jgi:hypothetical protein
MPSPARRFFTSNCLVTASNNGYSSASVVKSSVNGGFLPVELFFKSRSKIYVTTDGQSASLSWNKAPIWSLRPDFHYCETIAGLLIWGVLSDERTGLSLTIYNIFTFYMLLHECIYNINYYCLSCPPHNPFPRTK